MEWLLLVVLVPAIAIPVVLQWGFAGCDLIFLPNPRPETVLAPIDVQAVGISLSSIRVTWANPNAFPTSYRVERTKQGDTEPVPIETTETTITDDGLEEGTTYFYDVFAIRIADGDESAEPGSDDGTTLAFARAFETVLTSSQADLQGFCIIQRIEPLRLEASGGNVRITLHGAVNGPLTLDRITISSAAPAGDLYDAAPDLIDVATGVDLPADQVLVLPPVPYTLNQQLPLLIAFDINPTPGRGNVRRRLNVQSDEASMFFRAASADAGVPDRVPTPANPTAAYSPSDSIYIVEKIEVVPNG
jgi:hypothetical protein